MDRTKVYEFMVEDTAHYIGELPYKIVESYHPGSIMGFDIYRVVTDDFTQIRVVFFNGTEYMPSNFMKAKSGKDTIYYVNEWTPVTEV